MSEHYKAVTDQLEIVPAGQKIAFGIGMLANQMFPAALGIFMVILVKDLGFPPILWGIAFFLPRIFDALTDPIMGFISDNTRSRWGRRRQYVLLGAIVMGISYILMWQLHKDNSLTYNFAYFMSFSFLFYLGLTIFSVPYVAMGYEMSSDFHERTRIMAVAQWIGQWAWVISPWFWVIIYKPEWFDSPAAGCRQLAVWVGLICMGFAIVPALFIKSKSTIDADHLQELSRKNLKKNIGSFFNGFADAFRNTPFRKLCISTFFIFNSFNTIAAFSFFIIVYYLFGGDAGAAGIWPTLHGSVASLITTFIVIPTVSKVSQRIGKKKTFVISQSISIIGYILFWFLFVPGKPYLFLVALPFFSFGIGGLFTLMMSMTADVCDLDEFNTGLRREGVFGAIFWWMVKFGFAVAGLLSGLIMAIVNFTPDAAIQPEGAITGMRIFYSALPIAGTIGALLVMWNYDLSEKRANEIRKVLEERHLVNDD
jgi:GPH family glycoside/pentoside/hexuronide:cation symporter